MQSCADADLDRHAQPGVNRHDSLWVQQPQETVLSLCVDFHVAACAGMIGEQRRTLLDRLGEEVQVLHGPDKHIVAQALLQDPTCMCEPTLLVRKKCK